MGAEEKNRITVEIYGTHYKLMGSSSITYMRKIADHVNDQMNHIAENYPKLDTPRIAVLASVNMADDYHKLQRELEQVRREKLQDEEELIILHQAEAKLSEHVRELEAKYAEQVRELKAKHADQVRELGAQNTELKLASAARQDERSVLEDYRKLKEEYTKLQNEYNEWIELVEKRE